jgi:hypothetical protein
MAEIVGSAVRTIFDSSWKLGMVPTADPTKLGATAMNRTIELPEPIYNRLIAVSRANGVSPVDWIAAKLPNGPIAHPSESDQSSALERLLRHAGSISLGYPTGTDNEAIDADLAREYGDTHEDES